jgi:NhaP-type Na+/H+ or K+/H+ antiporter
MILKIIFITFLVLYLAYKIAGFALRFFLRSAGVQFNTATKREGEHTETSNKQRNKGKKRPLDSLGEYVDFEEVK